MGEVTKIEGIDGDVLEVDSYDGMLDLGIGTELLVLNAAGVQKLKDACERHLRSIQ